MEGEPRFVGIDVSKAQLDVAIRPTGKRWVLPNDETGIETPIPQILCQSECRPMKFRSGAKSVSEV